MRRALLLSGLAIWLAAPAGALVHLGAPSEDAVSTWLDITTARVTVQVNGRLATTHLDQTFRNRAATGIEGVGELCLPAGATVTGLAVWTGGQRLLGAATATSWARESYQTCLARAGQRPASVPGAPSAYRLHVFPVPARGTCRVEVDYLEVLPWQQGTLTYRLPLAPPDSNGGTLGLLQVEVHARGTGAAIADLDPRFASLCVVERPTADSLTVAFADEGVVADGDWAVGLQPVTPRSGPWVASAAPQGARAGYYVAWANQPAASVDPALPHAITLAVDASSSMVESRWDAVQHATRALLASLRPEDHFGLVVFGNQSLTWPPSPVGADSAAAAAALEFLSQRASMGATNYSAALQAACGLAFPDGQANQVVLLTDGPPMLGETDADSLATQAGRTAPEPFTLSAVGLGEEVDNALLDRLCRRLGGVATAVPADGNLTANLTRAVLDVAHRVRAVPRMEVEGSESFDVVTEPAEPVAEGQELTQVGRYRVGGALSLALANGPPGSPVASRYPIDLAPAVGTVAGPTPQVLFADDFVDASGGWQQVPGTEGLWTLDQAAGLYQVVVDGYSWVWVQVPATEYTIQTRVCPGSWSTKVVYANADRNELAQVDLLAQLDGVSGLRLLRPTSEMVVVPFPVTRGQWYTLQVQVGNGVVTTYVDGRLVHDHVPTPGVVHDGAIGIGSYGPTHETVFDYVRVYAGADLGPVGSPAVARGPVSTLWARQRWAALTAASGWSTATAGLGTDYGIVTPQTALLAAAPTAAAWLEEAPSAGPATAVNEPAGDGEPARPGIEPRLAQNAPNPFNASTSLRFWLPADAPGRDLRLAVYNLAGQQVRAWDVANPMPGDHTFVWDGRDEDGNEAASGVYLVRLQWGQTQAWRRAVLVR